MKLFQNKELKESLRSIVLVYILVISFVLAVFLIRTMKQQFYSGGGRIIEAESLTKTPYENYGN